MSNELFCPQHGPYPASYGDCPFCTQMRGGRPAVGNIDQEDTYDGHGRAVSDDDETVPPGRGGNGGWGGGSGGRSGGGSDETLPPSRGSGGGRGILDQDETQLPQRKTKRLLDPDDLGDDGIDETVLNREDTSLMGWFIVKNSPSMRRGHMIKLKSGAIIGRSPKTAHMLVDDDKVSGIHARIQIKENAFVIIDLGSSNGTFVNDAEALGPVVLKQDDMVRIGNTTFVLKTL